MPARPANLCPIYRQFSSVPHESERFATKTRLEVRATSLRDRCPLDRFRAKHNRAAHQNRPARDKHRAQPLATGLIGCASWIPPKNFRKKQLAEALDQTLIYGRPKFMKKSIKVDQKRKRGRPATGRDPMVS